MGGRVTGTKEAERRATAAFSSSCTRENENGGSGDDRHSSSRSGGTIACIKGSKQDPSWHVDHFEETSFACNDKSERGEAVPVQRCRF